MKVAIIGGSGKMGQWFARPFAARRNAGSDYRAEPGEIDAAGEKAGRTDCDEH